MTKIFKLLTTAAVSCGLAFSVTTGASATSAGALSGLKAAAPQSQIIDVRGRGGHRHHHHRGRNIGLGILGAAAATAIIAGAASANRGYDRGRGDRCDYYDYKCSRGNGWACRKFDRYCY